jgi:hypothetical protein
MERQSTLDLVYKLCRALEGKGVAYCHWKSNAALGRSARGDNDLDLLVSRAHAQLSTDIPCRLEFKEARASAEKQLPGVLSHPANGHPHDLTTISGPVAVDRRPLTAKIVCIAPFHCSLPFEVHGRKRRKATSLATLLSN